MNILANAFDPHMKCGKNVILCGYAHTLLLKEVMRKQSWIDWSISNEKSAESYLSTANLWNRETVHGNDIFAFMIALIINNEDPEPQSGEKITIDM